MRKHTSNAYKVVKHLHVTEKAQVLQNLQSADGNPCVARCKSPKYVFVVDPSANKKQIAEAVEEIYRDRNVKVKSVNTINLKGKMRRVRGRRGRTAAIKKAIVTFEAGDSLES
ncbi:MAG: 50S ribosomal protein L23 [Chlamydiia bacterium]|nr:50S ribosomal protein L23 [Chlamydiia bacterium]